MSNSIAAGGPNSYICYKLSRVMRRVQRYYEARLAPFEITPVQFYVLSALLWSDGMKFKDLAKSVGIDGSTLTGILDRMERGGFVERRDDPEDRRSLLIYITEKSKEMGPTMIEMAEKLDREIKEQFPGAEFATFMKVLDQLGDSSE
ncbi:MAG: MarR family winged helix-turn-helix transcriptional regulator [Firmicutes bacterium]|nr:MarR family winged helix-turn-helix transcriptional regulator [Bacillota bacterium]